MFAVVVAAFVAAMVARRIAIAGARIHAADAAHAHGAYAHGLATHGAPPAAPAPPTHAHCAAAHGAHAVGQSAVAARPAVAAADRGSARGDGQHRRRGGRVRRAVDGRYRAVDGRHRAIDGRHRAIDRCYGAVGRGAQYIGHEGHRGREMGRGRKKIWTRWISGRGRQAQTRSDGRERKENAAEPSKARARTGVCMDKRGRARQEGRSLFTSTRFFRSPDPRAMYRVAVACPVSLQHCRIGLFLFLSLFFSHRSSLLFPRPHDCGGPASICARVPLPSKFQ